MYIIADSGSTKCDWTVVDDSSSHTIKSVGINALMLSAEQIDQIICSAFGTSTQADAVYYYGAGCGSQFPQTTALLVERLRHWFHTDCVTAESDLTAAARALFGNECGIACILGTGANSCLYDGEQIVKNVPPLGFILGDEGGGTVIARKVVADILKGLASQELHDALMSENNLTYKLIISRVYCEPMPNRFLASLMPFVKRHIDDKAVRRIVESSFDDFIERNISQYTPHNKVSFIGGVADAFSDILRARVEAHGYTIGQICKSPTEGLLQYHNGK